MDLQRRKIDFVQEFLRLENEALIAMLEKLLHRGKKKAYEGKLKPMSEAQLDQEIDQALEDARTGKLSSAADLKARAEKWH